MRPSSSSKCLTFAASRSTLVLVAFCSLSTPESRTSTCLDNLPQVSLTVFAKEPMEVWMELMDASSSSR
eukprot:7191735-Pyramimonas_sp.AAC.1